MWMAHLQYLARLVVVPFWWPLHYDGRLVDGALLMLIADVQTASPETLNFLQELRKVCESC